MVRILMHSVETSTLSSAPIKLRSGLLCRVIADHAKRCGLAPLRPWLATEWSFVRGVLALKGATFQPVCSASTLLDAVRCKSLKSLTREAVAYSDT